MRMIVAISAVAGDHAADDGDATVAQAGCLGRPMQQGTASTEESKASAVRESSRHAKSAILAYEVGHELPAQPFVGIDGFQGPLAIAKFEIASEQNQVGVADVAEPLDELFGPLNRVVIPPLVIVNAGQVAPALEVVRLAEVATLIIGRARKICPVVLVLLAPTMSAVVRPTSPFSISPRWSAAVALVAPVAIVLTATVAVLPSLVALPLCRGSS